MSSASLASVPAKSAEWSKDEIEFLREAYPSRDWTIARIAERLRRGVFKVRGQARHLSLYRPEPIPIAPCTVCGDRGGRKTPRGDHAMRCDSTEYGGKPGSCLGCYQRLYKRATAKRKRVPAPPKVSVAKPPKRSPAVRALKDRVRLAAIPGRSVRPPALVFSDLRGDLARDAIAAYLDADREATRLGRSHPDYPAFRREADVRLEDATAAVCRWGQSRNGWNQTSKMLDACGWIWQVDAAGVLNKYRTPCSPPRA